MLYPVTSTEGEAVIRTLKNKNSCGDNIKVAPIKRVSTLISKPLEHIANLIFESGIFPSPLKLRELL